MDDPDGHELSFARPFWLVHIGDPSSNQATTLESQMIHLIQELFGQTLKAAMRKKMAHSLFAYELSAV
jgi:hypothetical protein